MYKDDKQKIVISGINEYTNIQYFFTSNQYELPLDKLSISSNHQFSPKRLSDFSTGRYCAMKALEQIGIQNVIIPIGKNREPIWPEGIVGSISHCDTLTGAIVSRKADHISLGLDIEEIGRVTADLWPYVFTDKEIEYLNTLPIDQQELICTSIFSLKEAFYKFQFPITNLFLDFLDVEVQIPELNRMVVLSGLIPSSSLIHNNKLIVQNYENTVISVILSE